MRILTFALAVVGVLTVAAPAQAATVVILMDPVTLQRSVHVVDGPDRILLCTAPPSVSGCRDVTRRRR